MMEFFGRTYEEAVSKALEKLNVSKDELIIEKISDNPTSILDILKEKQTGQVYIRVKLKSQVQQKELSSEDLPEYVQKSLKIIKDIANYMQAKVDVKVSQSAGDYILEIEGEDKGLLIGKHGNTLNSLQNYVNFIINKNVPKDKRSYVIVDSDNYRERRKKQLIDLALKTARIVQQKKEPVTLPPMLAFERRIIHITLKDNQYVTTYSIGENPYKSVVIAPLLDSSEVMHA